MLSLLLLAFRERAAWAEERQALLRQIGEATNAVRSLDMRVKELEAPVQPPQISAPSSEGRVSMPLPPRRVLISP